MAKVSDLTAELAGPIAAENGCSLWDVEYVKEAGDWYLRVYICLLYTSKMGLSIHFPKRDQAVLVS